LVVVVVVVVVRTPTPNYLRQASQNLGKYSWFILNKLLLQTKKNHRTETPGRN
jgi:hypothetical protein